MSDELLMDVVCEAHNDSAGIDGLVPTLLVFGAFPILPVRTGCDMSATNSNRAKMRSTAMREFSEAIDKLRFETTQKIQAPTVPDSFFPGDPVLVRRKDSKCWEGPFALISQVPRGFYVKSSQKDFQLHSTAIVKKYACGAIKDDLLPPFQEIGGKNTGALKSEPVEITETKVPESFDPEECLPNS